MNVAAEQVGRSVVLTLTAGGETVEQAACAAVAVVRAVAAGRGCSRLNGHINLATAQIYKVDAKLDTVPAASDLTYNGGAQPLVTGGHHSG